MDNAAELIKLARERFGVLSAADEKLLSAVARGENADFSSDSNEDNDPAQAQDWSEERAFNAYRIAWLCTDAPASALVTHRGIRLELARIDENLDLDWAKVPFPSIFRRCAFSGPISLRFAKVRGQRLNGNTKADNLPAQLKLLPHNGEGGSKAVAFAAPPPDRSPRGCLDAHLMG